MEFLNKDLADYAERHTSPEPEVLKLLNRETHLKVLMPRMLSGHLQGRLLSMFSWMIRPSAILEIGTYTGYSALCFAEGLKEGGKVHTIDINEELEGLVREFVKKAGMEDRVVLHYGKALDIIPALDMTFDLVFIDADKVNNLKYYNMVMDKVRKGGFIIADNVLWSGKVADRDKADKDTVIIREFNDFVQQDDRVENILLPVRDGLLVVRKK